MSTTPRVCVVASAYDRSALLPPLVRGLQAQTVADFEAILVDNGSSDDTADHLRRLTAGDDRFRVVRLEDNRGPARARNLAWRSTTAPWVAFTDDDCAPEPTWLEELLAVGEDADIVQGWTGPELDPDGEPGWFDRSQRISGWSGRYETCNLLVRRSLLEQLEGFDETFRIAMGEDTDLGLRAERAGARTGFAERAVIRHHVWRSGFGDYLRQRARWAEQVELMRVNPDARRHLLWGRVGGGTHLAVYALLPVTAVSVAARRPWVPVALVLAWCSLNAQRSRHKPFGFPRRVGYSGLEFIGRVYETWCFARASVRYRTFVP